MVKEILKVLILVFLFLFPTISQAEELTVAVAANVQYAFQEIKTAFEQETGITIKEVFGSSGNFVSQIKQGAPFDVFLSADMEYPQALERDGLAVGAPKVYAYGTLVLWTLHGLDLSKGLGILTDPSVKTIAIPNPQTAPYGRQAVNALKAAGIYDQVSSKFIFGENVSQTNQFIATKSSEIGFTSKSVVVAAGLKDQGTWAEVDKNTYEPIAQGAVMLTAAQKRDWDAAQKFFEFLFSPSAKSIFEKYGYILP